jgi:hypothetical protein
VGLGTQRYVDLGSQAGHPWRAAEANATIKAAKCSPTSSGSQAAEDARTQGHFRGPSPKMLRGVMQTLAAAEYM